MRCEGCRGSLRVAPRGRSARRRPVAAGGARATGRGLRRVPAGPAALAVGEAGLPAPSASGLAAGAGGAGGAWVLRVIDGYLFFSAESAPPPSPRPCRIGVGAEQRRRDVLERPRRGGPRLVHHDRHAGVHRRAAPRCRTGSGSRPGCPSTCSISRTSSFTCVFARFSTSFSFGPATVDEVEGLHADLEVLDARDVHAADEQDVVGRLDQRERECRRTCVGRSTMTWPRLRLERRAHGDELVGRDARRERRLGRRRQHEQAAVVAGRGSCASARGRRSAPTAAASTTVCCGGMPSSTATSPNWRSASTSATGSSMLLRHARPRR